MIWLERFLWVIVCFIIMFIANISVEKHHDMQQRVKSHVIGAVEKTTREMLKEYTKENIEHQKVYDALAIVYRPLWFDFKTIVRLNDTSIVMLRYNNATESITIMEPPHEQGARVEHFVK